MARADPRDVQQVVYQRCQPICRVVDGRQRAPESLVVELPALTAPPTPPLPPMAPTTGRETPRLT